MSAPEDQKLDAALEHCRTFLRSFGQTLKLLSLYSSGHPIPASAQQEAWHLLHEIFAETSWPELTIALVAGRWVVNERVVADSAQAYELLAIAFRAHALQSLTFRPECRPYEFAALCELASTPANRAYKTDAADFLKERGVRHIAANVEEFVRAKRVNPISSPVMKAPSARVAPRPAPEPPRPPASKPAPTAGPSAPKPAAKPAPAPVAESKAEPPAPSPTPSPAPVTGFGSFIRGLVEKTVEDPQERAHIYADAVRYVEQAIARHVSDATHRLVQEKQGVINERVRTESVFSNVAHGKVVVDQDGRVLMMDPAAEQIVGRPFSAVAGKNLLEELAGGEQFVSLSQDLVLPENRPVSEAVRTVGSEEIIDAFRSSVAVVHDEHGRVVGAYAVLPHAAKFRETQRLQEEFVANVTHDLKAPLTSVCSALEVLASNLGDGLKEEDREFLDICVRNSRTLRQMIDELLDFSKIRSGRMTVHPERTALDALLDDCARALLPWARSKRIEVEIEDVEAVRALPAVFADRGRVAQVLSNLVSNAIKYTPDGGRVVLSASSGTGEREGQVVVRVRDTGVGIAPEDQKRIFERFAQSDAAKREGVGLGLTIARELIAQHRGEIWVESEPGKGSTFSFTLPVYGSQPAPVPARRSSDRLPDEPA